MTWKYKQGTPFILKLLRLEYFITATETKLETIPFGQWAAGVQKVLDSMKAYRELSSLLVSRFYLDSFITGLFKAGIMSRSLEDAEAGGLHRRKNVEQQENLKVFKKLCLTKESQSYYLHFCPHSFTKQFRMRLILKPVTQNC